jgi:aminoglycoside phosphotransferase (APT) family kinase protein
MSLYDAVVRRVAVRTPRIVGGNAEAVRPFIIYEDDGLVPVRPTAGRFRATAALMARIHATDLRTVSLPADAQSHTPPLREVAQAAAVFWTRDVAAALDAAPGPSGLRARLAPFVAAAFDALPLIGKEPAALLHGDLHLGNVMAARKGAQLFIIDWEFVHANSPYFDLLQLSDATSPFVPLQGPANRLATLAAYMEAAGIPDARRQAFARGYLSYAALHLVWILARIRSDSAAGRFQPAALMRQTRESQARLLGLAHDYASLDQD